MKLSLLSTLAIAVLLSAGCLHHRPAPVAAAPSPIVTPDESLTARVLSYNSTGRFVVLGFPVGRMPRQEQGLFLYRNGIKVGEVRINGPQRDNNVVADLITGEAQVGDEVRDQ